MANTQLLRKRIRSVGNIRQITKAMEMVAAAKMRRAVERRAASSAYAKEAFDFLQDLIRSVDPALHPLLKKPVQSPTSKKVLVIAVASDRGLAGSFNTNVLKETLRAVKEIGEGASFVTVGKKICDTLRRRYGERIIADFTGLGDKLLTFAETTPIAHIAISHYLENAFDRVVLVATHFESSLLQRAQVSQVLPIARADQLDSVETTPDYRFEPSKDIVLDAVLRRLVEIQIFQTLVESNASEHSARMVAMKNATDAAGDLIEDLQLTYNQERQAGITRELAEISVGAEALQGA